MGNEYEKIPPLLAQARTNDPLSSHVAADKASHTLKDDLRCVLKFVNQNPGCTTYQLGVFIAYAHCNGEQVTEDIIEDIMKLSSKPHKKMHELIKSGHVRIEERAGGNLNWLTEKGKAALK